MTSPVKRSRQAGAARTIEHARASKNGGMPLTGRIACTADGSTRNNDMVAAKRLLEPRRKALYGS